MPRLPICGHLSRLSHVRQNLLVCFRVTRLESRPLCWLGGQVNDARPVLLGQESFSIEVVGRVADPRRIVRVETASHSRAHDRDSLGQLDLRETYAQCPRDLLDNLYKCVLQRLPRFLLRGVRRFSPTEPPGAFAASLGRTPNPTRSWRRRVLVESNVETVGGVFSDPISPTLECRLSVQERSSQRTPALCTWRGHRVDLFQVELEDVCMSMNVVPFFAKLDVDSVATHGPSGSVPEDM